MEIQQSISKLLQIKRDLLLKGIESAKVARDSASSPMESHHDTTRTQNEKLVTALENKLRILDKIIENLPNKSKSKTTKSIVEEWRYVEVFWDGKLLLLYIVPEGIGGEVINNIRLICTSAPLGEAINNKKKGETFFFNGKDGVVKNIR